MIAQTLHGYDQGHRLLAIGGDVDDTELSLLDRLSDLSGYVPLGTEFDRYHTGFPCGRYYAFACTWPDTSAPRAGTVLTHTLLVPRSVLASSNDLYGLGRLHRRPESAADREPYKSALTSDIDDPTAVPPAPDAARALAGIVLWFGQEDRPVLWVDDARPDDVVRYLWSLLWPEARWSFTFCTFALQVRFLRRQPFGFLALPPSARGSFHERARSAAWWQEGELTNAALRERTGDGWAKVILEQGAEATWAMRRFCEAEGLPLPAEPQYPIFGRFIDLEAPSASRLTAARARADLLTRLWPEALPTHPLVRATLVRLLERQADASLTPRPFWELGDFLARPAVRALAEADAEFASTVADVVGNETRRRFPRIVSDGMAELVALLQRATLPHVYPAILDAVQSAIGSIADEEAADVAVRVLVGGAAELRDHRLAKAALSALPPARRTRPALDALEACSESDRGTVTDYILTAADRLDDPLLAFDTWAALGEPGRGLEDAVRIVLGDAGVEAEPERLRSILARSGPEETLTWALGTTDARIASWAGGRGAEAAEKLQLSIDTLLARCQGAPNGAHVLLSRLASLPASALPDEKLFSLPVSSVLTLDLASSPLAKRFLERAVVRLVSHLAEGGLDAAQRAIWLQAPAVQDALAHASPWVLFGTGGARAYDRDCLANLARAVSEQIRAYAETTIFWVPNVLSRPLEESGSKSLECAVSELSVVLSVARERDGWLSLAAAVLVAVRRTGCATARPLVEQTFLVLYSRLLANGFDPQVKALMGRSGGYDWDIARGWRHWLLDAWVEHRWPPASFFACLGDDETLFYQVARRARWKYRGRDFLRTLRDAAERDTALAKRWAAPVEQALGYDTLPVDYD